VNQGLVRVCLVVLAGLYLAAGIAAISGFFQMRTGSADLAAWFSSNGMPMSRFLVVGIVYCAVGVTGIAAAWVLRRNNPRGRFLASVFVILAALDILGDFYGKRKAGFTVEDVVDTALPGILLLVTCVYLIQHESREVR